MGRRRRPSARRRGGEDAELSPLFIAPADRDRLARAAFLVFLVGGYDGSANYGDVAMLDAATALAERLGPVVTVVPVVELLHRATHARLYPEGPGRARPAVTLYAADAGHAPDGLERASLSPGVRAGSVYLYGGGYLNAQWGARRLTLARAADALLREAGLPPASVITSGLQIDADWIASCDHEAAATLRRATSMGVRDDASAAAAAAAGYATVPTGDDAVGTLVSWEAAAAKADATPRQLNVHVNLSSWVTEAGEAQLGALATLIAALRAPDAPIQPVIAYDDQHTSERPAAARLRELCIERGVDGAAFAEPITARSDRLDEWVPALARGALTLSSSYHVALTSLLTGVPAALLADNGYYRQKWAGLRADFGLLDAFALEAGDDGAAKAREIAAALEATRAELARRVPAVVERRLLVERDLLGQLAGTLLTACLESAPDGDDGAALSLARLRADHQTLVRRAEAERDRAVVAEASHEAHVAALEAEQAQAAGRLGELEAELASERRAHALTEQARGAEEAAHRAEIVRREVAERALETVAGSASWKITAPLRELARRLRRDQPAP